MSEVALPRFRYHFDPVASRALVASDAVCDCCGQARGFIYDRQPYAIEDLYETPICAWCIADGAAAAKYDCTFVSDAETSLPPGILEELTARTPGYQNWQGEWWLVHCGDACEFRGELTGDRFAALPDEIIERAVEEAPHIVAWLDNRQAYRRGAGVSVYEFACRHCGLVRLHADAC